MPKVWTVAIGIVVLALSTPGVQIAAIFNPERIRLLDQNNTSILVRGNAPINRHGNFDPQMVLKELNTKFQSNHDSLKNHLIVVSLLSSRHSDEKRILQQQIDYYNTDFSSTLEQNHNKDEDDDDDDDNHQHGRNQKNIGFLLHRPIVGSWLALPWMTQYFIGSNKAFQNWTIWKYFERYHYNNNNNNNTNLYNWRPDDGAWDLAFELKSLLDLYSQNSTVIYIHCMRGMDRTGLVSGTYLNRWKDYSPEQVRDANWDVAQRKLNWPAHNALEWILSFYKSKD